MRVLLSGYNLDSTVIDEARQQGVDPDRLTPETLSAAYARISRNPAPVDQLRAKALEDVSRARKSNQQIVFQYGHHSVAEHAVLNFDIIGLSRLGIEALEHHRLCSYTEKSQRYIKLDDDVVLPEEVVQAGLEEPFSDLVRQQSQAYETLYETLYARAREEEPDLASTRAGRQDLKGRAKEDARYVTSLAMAGQLGFTANARNLELVCRRLGAHPLAEVRQLAGLLRQQGKRAAPSLILFDAPAVAEPEAARRLAVVASELVPGKPARQVEEIESVRLKGATKGADTLVAAALLSEASGASLQTCMERAQELDRADLRRVFLAALAPMSLHDSPPRALEMPQLRFQLVVSAACFGQLKRHRMATLIPGDYASELGVTVPPAVQRAGQEALFLDVAAQSEALYGRLREQSPQAAPYALTQAHRRQVLMQINARDLYHFSRLRMDGHAQWDIRALACEMVEQAREVMPLTLMLACGKDRFEAVYEEEVGDQPGG